MEGRKGTMQTSVVCGTVGFVGDIIGQMSSGKGRVLLMIPPGLGSNLFVFNPGSERYICVAGFAFRNRRFSQLQCMRSGTISYKDS